MTPIVGGPLHGHQVFLLGKTLYVVRPGGNLSSGIHHIFNSKPYILVTEQNGTELYYRHKDMDPTVAQLARMSIT